VSPRRLLTALLTALVLATAIAPAALPTAAVAAQPAPRVSFDQMQQEFMCTLCGEALNVARSPQAYSENETLRQLVAKGLDANQIKQAMVDNYGPGVLAKPPAHGFNLLVYLIPAAVVVLILAVLGYTLPRWRRRSRAQAAEPAATGPRLSDEDARRLDADLAQHL
jgi:cytochrome c-type biogenesis protein CcmH